MGQTIIILIALIISIAGIVFYISKKFKQLEELRKGDSGMQILNQNMQALQHNITSQIHQTNSAVNERLDHAARVISAVTHELGQMQQIGSQLRNFQDFLKSPKLRGNLGEQGLKELLSSGLPRKHFQLQYSFRSGVIVDAIINLESGKIPIDSKFPLENFNNMLKAEDSDAKEYFRRKFKTDFKNHVNAISKKYINPDEGTADFAFMYIPSESIFFEVVNNEHDLFEYAANNHVIASSPSTFFYYLRTIMLGLEGKRITEMSREILKTLRTLKNDSKQFGETIGVLNKHIANASKTMTQANEHYLKLAQNIEKIDALEDDQDQLLESGDK